MKPQLNRYFHHNGAKHRVSNQRGELLVFESWNPSPLYTLSTPASLFLIPDEAIKEARELLGDRKPERLERTIRAAKSYQMELATLLELTPQTIRKKQRSGNWTISEKAMVSGEKIRIPKDFYRLLHLVMYREELTRKTLAKGIGIGFNWFGRKINEECLCIAEKYYLTKKYLM
jgi:hypothetical protein